MRIFHKECIKFLDIKEDEIGTKIEKDITLWEDYMGTRYFTKRKGKSFGKASRSIKRKEKTKFCQRKDKRLEDSKEKGY